MKKDEHVKNNCLKNACTENNCFHLLPNVLRARGFRLYLANGQRLVDLWQNGGAAVMGHTPPNLLRELKNTASRGLFAPLPHFTENRFFKALQKLLPEHNFRVYAAPPQELVSLFNDGSIQLWRPFLNPVSPFTAENLNLIMPILQGIQTWQGKLPIGLCVAAAKSKDNLAQLPPGDTLSPILLAVAARGVHDILAAPQRANPVLPRVTKALKNSPWHQRGIYLHLNEEPAPEAWEALFSHFLEAGFLLPPNPSHPLILPGEMSAGEETKLAALLGATS